MWRAILFGTFIGAVFAALAGCDHQPEPASGAIPVRVVVAQPGSMEGAGITFSGTLVPRKRPAIYTTAPSNGKRRPTRFRWTPLLLYRP